MVTCKASGEKHVAPGAINQSAGSPATHTGKRTQCLRFFSVTPRRDEGHHIRSSTEGRATKRTAGRPADRACQPPMGFRNAQRFGSRNQARPPDVMAPPAAVLATADRGSNAAWMKNLRCTKRCFIRKGDAINLHTPALQCGAFLRPPQGAHYGCSPPSNAASAAALPTAD